MTDQPAQHDSQPFEPVAPEPAEPGLGAPPPAAPISAAAPSPAVAGTRPRSLSWVNAALALALAVAIGGIGFAAGRLTAPAALAAANGTGRFGNGAFPGGNFPGGNVPGGGYFQGGDDNGGGFRGAFGGGGASIEGTVESVSGDTLTLKLANGSTIQVSLSGTTTYHAQASATSGDVKPGGTVIVRVELNRGAGGGTISPSATDVTIVP